MSEIRDNEFTVLENKVIGRNFLRFGKFKEKTVIEAYGN